MGRRSGSVCFPAAGRTEDYRYLRICGRRAKTLARKACFHVPLAFEDIPPGEIFEPWKALFLGEARTWQRPARQAILPRGAARPPTTRRGGAFSAHQQTE